MPGWLVRSGRVRAFELVADFLRLSARQAPEEFFQQACDLLRRLWEADGVTLWRLDAVQRGLQPPAASAPPWGGFGGVGRGGGGGARGGAGAGRAAGVLRRAGAPAGGAAARRERPVARLGDRLGAFSSGGGAARAGRRGSGGSLLGRRRQAPAGGGGRGGAPAVPRAA